MDDSIILDCLYYKHHSIIANTISNLGIINAINDSINVWIRLVVLLEYDSINDAIFRGIV